MTIPKIGIAYIVDGGHESPDEFRLFWADNTLLDKRYYTHTEVNNMINNIDSTSSGSISEKEILYDSFLIAYSMNNYPITQDVGSRYSARQARHVWDEWDTNYNQCKVRMIGQTNGIISTGGPFNNKTDLYNWINSVIPNNGSQVTDNVHIQIYDIISGDVPGIQKVYGINSLYLRIVGSRNGKKSSIRTAFLTKDNAGVKNIIMLLSEYFTNEAILPFPISSAQYDANGENSKRVLWISGNKRNIYGLPRVNDYITLSNTIPPDPRHWWDFDNISSTVQNTLDAGGHLIQSMCYLVDYGGTYECVSKAQITSHMYSYTDIPIVAVYLIKHASNPDAWAFYMKPVGINTVYVDWFDQNLYRLESVGFNKDRQIRLKYCPCQVGQVYNDFIGDRTQVKKDTWIFNDNLSHMTNTGFVTPRKIKFRLRRLSDGKLGPLSHATIKPILRTRNAYLKWMVQ